MDFAGVPNAGEKDRIEESGVGSEEEE